MVLINAGLCACIAEAQQTAIATLPFAGDAGKAIYLTANVNGTEAGWWALDSGGSECLIDRSIAKRARLVMRGSRQIGGAGKGTVRLDSVRSALRVRFGDRILPTCDHFGAVDLHNANLDARHPLDGLLGAEFFSRYVVRIDFAAHTVTLYDPKHFRYTGSGDTVALHFVRRIPRIDVRIRTAKRPEVTRRLIVDTGSEDFVDDSTVRRNVRGSTITVPTTGLGKSYEAVIGILDTVRIGRSLFTQVPGVASDVGIVGNGILANFVCIFDYSRARLYLERRP